MTKIPPAAARLGCLVCAVFHVLAQTNPQPAPTTPEPVIRISVNLVQVDAVVTDSSGRQVTNLTAGDFKIFEDGRPQKITACSYVRTGPSDSGSLSVSRRNPLAPPTPAGRLKPEQVRRTVVLMVDDLGLSFESTARVRSALRKYVDTQMQAGDLVAVVRTRGGMGALQQLTADTSILYAAIDRVRWHGNGHASAFEPIGYDTRPNASSMTAAGPGGAAPVGNSGSDPKVEAGGDGSFSAGTLGAINFVLRALRGLPGRKAVILFSDGIPVFTGARNSGSIEDGLRQLADLANRSAVVLYTVDARGLLSFGLTAADNTNPIAGHMTPTAVAGVGASRRREYAESEDGLDYLARQTGGFFMHDSNDLDAGIVRALQDLSGYYLIGYKPEESSFEPEGGKRRFHRIQVKVKTAGLQVRSRSGYMGISEREAWPTYRTAAGQLSAALNSPFYSSSLNLRLTCLFAEEKDAGAAVRMLLQVDAHDLTFSEEPDGTRKVIADVAAFAIGEQGAVAGSSDRNYAIRLSPREYQQASNGGLVYKLNVPLEKPGAYQMRVAVRDAGSGKIGSASQFIEIPDVRQRHIALSGIVMNGAHASDSYDEDAANKNYEIAQPGTAAMRIFHAGENVSFAYVIFDARPDSETGLAKVETQFNLYRDGRPVYTSPETPLKTGPQADLSRLVASGTLRLGTALEPGEYIFQVVARDTLAPQRYRTASQWTDLEVAR